MPIYTQNYQLGMRLSNEPYLSAVDKSRMTIGDNELGFLTDLVGDGILSGWTVTVDNSVTNLLHVASGYGIIDRFFVRTYGPLNATLASDGIYYVFMQRKLGAVGGYSGFSPVDSFTYTDTTAPAAPVTTGAASYSTSHRTFQSISLQWTANSEPDLAGYNIYQNSSYTPSTATLIASIGVMSTPAYVVSGLAASTGYYFWVTAFDQTGNESAKTAINLPSTPISTLALSTDTRTPVNPGGLNVFAGNAVLQVQWLQSTDNFVSGYFVNVQSVNPDGTLGSVDSHTVSGASSSLLTLTQYLSSPLANNTAYQITVKSISANNGTSSAGVTVVGIPIFNDGPNEVAGLAATPAGVNGYPVINLSWTQGSGSSGNASSFTITVIQNNSQIGTPVTIPVGALSSFTYSVSLFQTVVNSLSVNGPLQENTPYSIRVQGNNLAGGTNIGVIVSTVTGKYSTPQTPTNVALVLAYNEYLEATWDNGTDNFDHLTISVTATDINSNVTTVLSTTNVGNVETYLINQFSVAGSTTYTLTLKSVDAEGNNSVAATATLAIGSTVKIPAGPKFSVRPSVGFITITWTASTLPNLANYKLYRCTYAKNINAGSFTLLDTFTPDVLGFDDHAVQDSITYGYLVTVVDSYGNESQNPNLGYVPLSLAFTSSYPNQLLADVSSLNGSASGFNYVLTWPSDSDLFDGYEIWRSFNNIHDFVLVGVVPSGTLTFTDTNALIQGGTYNYMVRKFRNDSQLYVNTVAALPANCTLLAKVKMTGGVVTTGTIDMSGATIIAGLQGPVLSLTAKAIAAHHHTYNSVIDDRRINLSTDWIVTDWTSANRMVYATKQDISDVSTWTVYVNGTVPATLYQLDTTKGTLTFASQLPRNAVVTVAFHNMGETQGILPASKIANLSAGNFTLGTVPIQAMPTINHDGRMGERLIPVSIPMTSTDQMYFTPVGGIGLSFFDVIVAADNSTLVAATSTGVSISTDLGITWKTVGTFFQPVIAVRYANLLQRYMALCGNAVYFSTSLLTDWKTYPGMDAQVRIVRSVTEDANGYLYAATDLGVYVLDPTLTVQRWQQRPLINYRTSDCFSVFYDSVSSQVEVSTDSGLFYTTNRGVTWTLWSAFPVTQAVYQMLIDVPNPVSNPTVSYMYALTENTLFRKKNSDTTFAPIAQFPSPARKMVIFGTLAYVSTEDGILTSTGPSSVSGSLEFVSILPQLSEGGQNYTFPCIASITLPSVRLLLGMDGRFYTSASTGVVNLQHQELYGQYPTFFVNGNPRNLGVYFNGSMALFDDRLDLEDTVSAAVNYTTYVAANGGWADISYAAPVNVYNNGTLLNDSANSVPASSSTLAALAIPALTSRNSTLPQAAALLIVLENALATLSVTYNDVNVAAVLQAVEQLEGFVSSSVTFTIPPVQISLYNSSVPPKLLATVDTVTGTFNVSPAISLYNFVNASPNVVQAHQFWKYSVVTADIMGVSLVNEGTYTHAQLDDLFELQLSGLYANLAAAKQVNDVKRAMFIEEQWPGSHESIFPKYQENVSVSCSGSTPTWYDTFNSTVDYKLRVRQNNAALSLQYAATVMYVPSRNGGEVWVGGLGGIIAVNVATLAVTSVWTTSDFVKWMYPNGNAMLVVTNENLYSISLTDLSVTQDNGTSLPMGLTSVAMAYNNIVVGAAGGIYFKDQTGLWTNSQIASSPLVYNLGDLLLSYDNTNNVYSSPGGTGWTLKGNTNQSGQIVLNRAAKFRSVYFATESGLYTDNSTFYSKTLKTTLVNVTGNPTTSAALVVNDVESNGTKFVIGLANGTFYSYSSMSGFGSAIPATGLDTVHKVCIVGSDIWLLGYDKLMVTSSGAIIKLATGNRLTWQP